MNEAVLEQTPANFTIEEIGDEARLYGFKRVFVESYEIPDWVGQGWVDATLAIGIGKTPWRMFVGYLDGAPVATNMLFNSGRVASIYAVATLPAARGQGIGAASPSSRCSWHASWAIATACSFPPKWACASTSASASS
jgi:ribosomal protein S18 acetylase RimI-like enzyme